MIENLVNQLSAYFRTFLNTLADQWYVTPINVPTGVYEANAFVASTLAKCVSFSLGMMLIGIIFGIFGWLIKKFILLR